jgi:membrane-associated phospholipid phosphatase
MEPLLEVGYLGIIIFLCLPFSGVGAFSSAGLIVRSLPISSNTPGVSSYNNFHPTTRHSPLPMSESDPEEEMGKSSDKLPQSPLSSDEKSGLLHKIGSTTSLVVAGTFFLVLAWKRDALMVSFFIGSISNGILSKILKKILKQERPAGLDESSLDLPPSDNGMPSSHAMSLGFIGTFTALQLPWTTVPLLIYGSISLVYRVKANLHSLEQVVVGVVLGSVNGITWRSLCLGNNLLSINIADWVSKSFLNEQGLLPWYGLAVPVIIGAAVVGSVERRVSRSILKKSKLFGKRKPE